MKITIEGDVKEIAALVLELQERREDTRVDVVIKELTDGIEDVLKPVKVKGVGKVGKM